MTTLRGPLKSPLSVTVVVGRMLPTICDDGSMKVFPMNMKPDPTKKNQMNGTFQRLNSIGTSITSVGNDADVAATHNSTTSTRSEIEPDCIKCRDSLWILAPAGDLSNAHAVVPCDCQTDNVDSINHLRTYSQLGYLERMTFGSLRRMGRRGRADANMFQQATEIARDFAENPHGWLVFEGSSGTGKTHLAASIVNAIIGRGAPAKYLSALEFPDLIRSQWFQDYEDSESGALTPLLNAPLLAIDDFGAQQSANWIDSKIDQLLTHRFNAVLPTVFVLAKPFSDLPDRFAVKLNDPDTSRVIRLTRTEGSRTGIPTGMLNSMSFDSFKVDGLSRATDEQRQYLKLGLGTAQDFAETPEKATPWIYLQGETGVGKTHIAVAIAKVSIDNGVDVTYWSLPDLLDRLRQTYSNRSETSFFSIFESVRDAELLILDDFGSQQMTDWSIEKLHQLVAYRHDRGLRTVIAGHAKISEPPDQLAGHPETLPQNLPSDWPLLLNSNRIADATPRLLLEHQGRSIISRLKDTRTVTIVPLRAPDFRDG